MTHFGIRPDRGHSPPARRQARGIGCRRIVGATTAEKENKVQSVSLTPVSDLNGYHLTIGYIRTEGGYGGTITNNATGSGTSTLTLASGLSELFDSTICDGPCGKLAVIIGSTRFPGPRL